MNAADAPLKSLPPMLPFYCVCLLFSPLAGAPLVRRFHAHEAPTIPTLKLTLQRHANHALPRRRRGTRRPLMLSSVCATPSTTIIMRAQACCVKNALLAPIATKMQSVFQGKACPFIAATTDPQVPQSTFDAAMMLVKTVAVSVNVRRALQAAWVATSPTSAGRA